MSKVCKDLCLSLKLFTKFNKFTVNCLHLIRQNAPPISRLLRMSEARTSTSNSQKLTLSTSGPKIHSL